MARNLKPIEGVVAPRFVVEELTPRQIDEPLSDEACYESLDITGARFDGQSAARVAFVGCRLHSAGFPDATLPGFELTDVLLVLCDLANVTAEACSFERVEIAGSRLVGLKAPEARFRDVLVRDSVLAFAQFRYGSFRHVRFEGCNLHNADFSGCDLRGVVFDGCDLGGAVCASARLDGTDIRTSQIAGLQVGLDSLRGLIVSPDQAIELAPLMGLCVR